MTVTFHTHVDHYVYETTDMPDELILNGSGTSMFDKTEDRIGPILNFSVNEINENSKRMIENHGRNVSNVP